MENTKNNEAGEALPMPTLAMGFTAAELEQYAADMAKLEADPRTAGRANRPRYLVDRVLGNR